MVQEKLILLKNQHLKYNIALKSMNNLLKFWDFIEQKIFKINEINQLQ